MSTEDPNLDYRESVVDVTVEKHRTGVATLWVAGFIVVIMLAFLVMTDKKSTNHPPKPLSPNSFVAMDVA